MTIEQDTQQATDTLVFAAYGTLRKGEALHDWIASEIVSELGTVAIKGAKLHFPTSHQHFPLLVWSGHISDRAVAELYELRVSKRMIEMLEMEMRAGYQIVEASVENENGELLQATVCVWPHTYGGEVPNNDWCSVERREWWR
jgi:gamma-glutamylcyclotransferase (GGCT)/AIG2-like uncharacterized protein YtfP